MPAQRWWSRSESRADDAELPADALLEPARGERVIVRRFLALPKEAWELRARLIPTITGFAADRRSEQDLVELCVEPVRDLV